jgi:hypothetical protein
MSDAIDQLVQRNAASSARLDALIDRMAAEDQRREQNDRRNQEQIDSAQRLDTQIKFAEALEPYGESAPAPVAGSDPKDYQFSLMKLARSKLSREDDRPTKPGSQITVSELASMKLAPLSDQLLDHMEPHFLDAVKLQGEAPHVSTLPPEGEVARYETDPATGSKATKFFARRSFIADMGMPSKLVAGFRLGGQLVNTSGVPILLRQR